VGISGCSEAIYTASGSRLFLSYASDENINNPTPGIARESGTSIAGTVRCSWIGEAVASGCRRSVPVRARGCNSHNRGIFEGSETRVSVLKSVAFRHWTARLFRHVNHHLEEPAAEESRALRKSSIQILLAFPRLAPQTDERNIPLPRCMPKNTQPCRSRSKSQHWRLGTIVMRQERREEGRPGGPQDYGECWSRR